VTVDRLGDKPAFARLRVSFTNFKTEKPVAVSNSVGTDVLPPLFAAAAERGLADALQTGEFGYPLVNVQARITDAKADPALSTEAAFEAAAMHAYRDAVAGNIRLLEPIMKVVVTCPAEFLGNILADLGGRRGIIERQESIGGDLFEVEAHVPLARLFDYADKVRSLSQGRAASAMEPYSYEPAPDDVVKQLLGE
jgi:elongation factor G